MSAVAAVVEPTAYLLPAQHPLVRTRTIEGPIIDIAPLQAVVEKQRVVMLKMMSAMQPYVCADDSRSGLNRVHLEVHDEKNVMLLATDGNTAIALAVEFFEPHGLEEGCVGITSASVKAFVSSKGYAPFVACPESEDFPWIRAVTSLADEPYAGAFGVNPIYFARITTAMKKLTYSKTTGCRVECGQDRLAPIVATAPPHVVPAKGETGVSVKLFVLTMPMRLEVME